LINATPLQIGDTVPHFELRSVDGVLIRYSTIWQHRNLVLVSLRANENDDHYINQLRARASAFDDHVSTCVVTREHIAGLAAPGLLVADRWGEIVHIVASPSVSELPAADRLLKWLEAIEYRCPECEGEAR
jgi:peroxiredoxin